MEAAVVALHWFEAHLCVAHGGADAGVYAVFDAVEARELWRLHLMRPASPTPTSTPTPPPATPTYVYHASGPLPAATPAAAAAPSASAGVIELLEREGCARGSSGGGSEKRPDVWAAEPAGGRNLWEGGRGMWHASREHVTAPRGACWAGGWRLDVGRPTDDDGWQYAASWEEPPAAWRDRPAKGHAPPPRAGSARCCRRRAAAAAARLRRRRPFSARRRAR